MCNRACKRFTVTSSVTVSGTDLLINIPQAQYSDCDKVCLYIAQALPDAATINMPVSVTIGTDTTQYPLVTCVGIPVTASMIKSKVLYPTMIVTNSSSGVFRILRKVSCNINKLQSIPAPTVDNTTTG